MINQKELEILQQANEIIQDRLNQLPAEIIKWAKESEISSIDESVNVVCEYYKVYPERLKDYKSRLVVFYVSNDYDDLRTGLLCEEEIGTDPNIELKRLRAKYKIEESFNFMVTDYMLIVEHLDKQDVRPSEVKLKWYLMQNKGAVRLSGWIDVLNNENLQINFDQNNVYVFYNKNAIMQWVEYEVRDKLYNYPDYLDYKN